MLGNNVGTSLSMQLFSFQVGKYAFFAIGIGLMVATLFKKDAIRQGGLIVLGLGLLFLGMNLMKESAAPLKDAGFFNSFIEAGAAPGILATLSGFLLGIAGSALMQSSGALIGILFAKKIVRLPATHLPILRIPEAGSAIEGFIEDWHKC